MGKLRSALMGVVAAPPREPPPFIEIAPDDPASRDPILIVSPPTPRSEESPRPDIKSGVSLFKFQQEAVDWLKDKSAGLLADEMGVGKTAAAIAWGKDRRPVLVLCPASLVLNWALRELGDLWRRDDSVLVLDGAVDLPATLPDWTVCSYGQVARYLPDLQRAGYQAIIIDEAHNIRNLTAQRTQNILSLVAPEKPRPDVKIPPYRLALTGTPIVNSPLDAFPLLVFLGERTMEDERGFRFSVRRSKENAARDVYNILKPIMLRRKKEEVYPDMPEKVHTSLVVPITNVEDYEHAEVAFLDWIREAEGQLLSRAQIEAQALVRLQALRGLVAEGKVEPVSDWLRPCLEAHEKALIFSSRIEPLEGLQQRHPESLLYTGELSKEERQAFVDKFQKDPGVCYFLGTYGAASVGITLTAAAKVVLFDLPWTPADKQQAEDRAHRFGQKRTVEVVSVLAKNTIDERVLELLDEKEKVIAETVEGSSPQVAARGSIAGDLLRHLVREAAQPGVQRQRPYKYVSDDEAEAVWAEQNRVPLPAGIAPGSVDELRYILSTYSAETMTDVLWERVNYLIALLRHSDPWVRAIAKELDRFEKTDQPRMFQGALYQAVMGQIPDDFGSRCRDPLGRWTISDLCPPVPRGEVAASAKTFALSADGTRRFEFEHQVVEAADLVTSYDPFTFELNPRFTQKLQPRKRERAATQVQVMRIAKELEPLSLLTDFRTFDRGAPIVGPDMLVESGNGRVMGYIRASKEYPDRAQAYREALLVHISEFGLTLADVEGKELPMLIRRRLTELTDDERKRFVEEANLPSGITRSAVEIARTDAERVTLDLLLSLEVGEGETLYDALKSLKNRPFVTRFLGTLPENERGHLLDAQGVVNLDGIRRIGQAVFVYVFRGEVGLKLAELAFETLDNDIRNVFSGIARALGPLAQAEALTSSGARDRTLSLGEDLALALRVYVRLRGAGTSVVDYLAQGQLESRELSPFLEIILKDVADRARSGRRIGDVLRAYANAVIAQPPPAQGGLFGDVRIGKENLWRGAVRQEQEDFEGTERGRRREPELVAAQLRQAVGLAGVIPKDRVDWCGLAPERVDAAWAWRPFRDAVLEGRGLRADVKVCGSDLSSDAYTLMADFTHAPHTGLSTGEVMAVYRRRVKTALGESAREVLEFGTKRVIFEVVLPGPEPEDLEWRPQQVLPSVPRREMAPQPALFQGAQNHKAEMDGPVYVSVTFTGPKGSVAVDVIADTGSAACQVTPAIVEATGAAPMGYQSTIGIGGRFRVPMVLLSDVAIQGRKLSMVPHLPPPAFMALVGEVPLVGYWVLQELRLDVHPRIEAISLAQSRSHSHSAPAAMNVWQYKVLIAELQLLQGHASDPTCPCGLADIGEYCHAKHLLSVSALAWETAAMDSHPQHHDMLLKLGDEANDLHQEMRAFVQDPEKSKGGVSLVEWSRQWRKQLEGVYYSKEMGGTSTREAKAAQGVTMGALVGSTISGLGLALGAALAGLIIAMISQRRKGRKEEEGRVRDENELAPMEIPDMLPLLDGLIKRLGV